MKIVYTTAKTPWGRGETFILDEMIEMKKQGVDLLIIPRNPSREVFHKKSMELLENSIWLPLINLKMIIGFLKALVINVSVWKILVSILIYSRNPWILIKNLIVFPKGVFLAGLLQKREVKHIHSPWGATTATMAYVISRLTNIPWSFTLHRGDIKANNMLKGKIKSAKFVRCISEHGKNELLELVGEKYSKKIKVIYVGIKIPAKISKFSKDRKFFTIVTPANLIEVKGHIYLIKACLILVKEGVKDFQFIFYGEGLLRVRLEDFIKRGGIADYIKIPGFIPHERLIEMYRNVEMEAVVLPSIVTNKGEHEGIPVSLMEAMSYGIPVISTNTGGIPELLEDGAGILVPEKDPKALAEQIHRLAMDREFRRAVAQTGRLRVKEKFNLERTAVKLAELFRNR